MRRIWQRYIIFECLKTFVFILFMVYFLFVLVDYTTKTPHGTFQELLVYYGREFFQRLNVLVPFSLLIASIRTLLKLNYDGELIALLGGGISLRQMMTPLLIIGLLVTCIQYLNMEVFLPNTVACCMKQQIVQPGYIQSVKLKDQSTLLYMHYIPSNQTFHSAWWVESFEKLHYFKELNVSKEPAIATGEERFEKTPQGMYIRSVIDKPHSVDRIQFHPSILLNAVTPPEEMPISKLYEKLPYKPPYTGKEAHILSLYFERMMTPWLSLIAILFPISYCLRFSRLPNKYLPYAIGVFIMLLCYLLLHASAYLLKKQVIQHVYFVVLPFIFIIGWYFFNYLNLNRR